MAKHIYAKVTSTAASIDWSICVGTSQSLQSTTACEKGSIRNDGITTIATFCYTSMLSDTMEFYESTSASALTQYLHLFALHPYQPRMHHDEHLRESVESKTWSF